MGERDPDAGRMHARLIRPIRTQDPRTQFLTAWLAEEQGALSVAPTPQQGSGMLTSLAQANAFIVVPEATRQLDAGAVVEVEPFGGDAWRS